MTRTRNEILLADALLRLRHQSMSLGDRQHVEHALSAAGFDQNASPMTAMEYADAVGKGKLAALEEETMTLDEARELERRLANAPIKPQRPARRVPVQCGSCGHEFGV
jgi:hypothetical protein